MTPPIVLKIVTVSTPTSKVDAKNRDRGKIIPIDPFQA